MIRKRSIRLQDRSTSIRLDDEHWSSLREIAAGRGVSVDSLVAEISAAWDRQSSLSGAVRKFVLRSLGRSEATRALR